MATNLSIEVNELRQLITIVLNHLEAQGRVISIPQEYYWAISGDARYNMECEPSGLTIGSLNDDVHQMQQLRGTDAKDLVPQHFVWLGAILTAIGERPAYLRNFRKDRERGGSGGAIEA